MKCAILIKWPFIDKSIIFLKFHYEVLWIGGNATPSTPTVLESGEGNAHALALTG